MAVWGLGRNSLPCRVFVDLEGRSLYDSCNAIGVVYPSLALPEFLCFLCILFSRMRFMKRMEQVRDSLVKTLPGLAMNHAHTVLSWVGKYLADKIEGFVYG